MIHKGHNKAISCIINLYRSSLRGARVVPMMVWYHRYLGTE